MYCILFAAALLAATAAFASPEAAAIAAPAARVGVSRVAGRPPARPDVFTTIQGNALDASNRPLREAVVRLRDARSGHVAGRTTPDRTGLFTFSGVDPGSYVAELLDRRDIVLAASPLLHASAGETVSTIVKLPGRTPPAAGLLGATVPSALAITTAAAAAGVLATEVTGAEASPTKVIR